MKKIIILSLILLVSSINLTKAGGPTECVEKAYKDMKINFSFDGNIDYKKSNLIDNYISNLKRNMENRKYSNEKQLSSLFKISEQIKILSTNKSLSLSQKQILSYLDFKIKSTIADIKGLECDFLTNSQKKVLIYNSENFTQEEKNDYSKFPKYNKNINIKLDDENASMPEYENDSIITINENSNQDNFYIEGDYKLIGKMSSDVEKVEIIWNGDYESYFLNNFVAGNKDFSYNIKKSLKNIKNGKNIYLIRGYAKNKIYERFVVINFVDYSIVSQINKTNIDYTDNNQNNGTDLEHITKDEYFVREINKDFVEYELFIGYGKKLFETKDYNIEISNKIVNSNEDYSGWITIYDKNNNKKAKIEDILFKADLFSAPKIRIYKNTGNITFSILGHESPIYYSIFNKQTSKIISVFDILEKNVKIENYYTNIKLNNSELVIESVWNPWSESNTQYKIIYDMNLEKIISNEIIKPQIVKDYGNNIIHKQITGYNFLELNGDQTLGGFTNIIQYEKGKSGFFVLGEYSKGDTFLEYIKYSGDYILLSKHTYTKSNGELAELTKKVSKFELLANKQVKVFYNDNSIEIVNLRLKK